MSTEVKKDNFIPGSDADCEDIFKYPFTVDDETVEYLRNHGRIMFIIRGLAGTGKDSLATMLSSKDTYPNAVICCADHYFKNTFSSNKREPKSLAESHAYCKKRVEQSCQKGIHPIVVKNTHVKIFEMQPYLNLAAKYNYTVIIVSTVDKFFISPEILAKSNTKGLDAEYFRRRLKQWQEILPVLAGWFISPGDSSFILDELKTSLEHLLGDGKFCRVMNIFENEKILDYFKVKKLLYCIAACSERNFFTDLRSYCSRNDVKECYGKSFTLTIKGFIISSVSVLAIVHLDESTRALHYNKPFVEASSDPVNDELSSHLSSLNITAKRQDNFAVYSGTCSFTENRLGISEKTATVEEWEKDETVDIKSCSCIHLAQSRMELGTLPWHTKLFFHKLLVAAADTDGLIQPDQFGELENGYRYYRLPKNTWMVKPPFKISFKSVFTGIYA